MTNSEIASNFRNFISILLFKLGLRTAGIRSARNRRARGPKPTRSITHQRPGRWILIGYLRRSPAERERFHALALWGKRIRIRLCGRDKTTSLTGVAFQTAALPE